MKVLSLVVICVIVVVVSNVQPIRGKNQNRAILTFRNEDGQFANSNSEEYLTRKRSLDAVNEFDKAACCLAAFNLCEIPPAMKYRQFRRTRNPFLREAKALCSKVYTVQLTTHKQICTFFHQPIDCAYLGTKQGVELYEYHLPECCARANEACVTSNSVSYFLAKRECMGYLVQSDGEICRFSKSTECKKMTKKP